VRERFVDPFTLRQEKWPTWLRPIKGISHLSMDMAMLLLNFTMFLRGQKELDRGSWEFHPKGKRSHSTHIHQWWLMVNKNGDLHIYTQLLTLSVCSSLCCLLISTSFSWACCCSLPLSSLRLEKLSSQLHALEYPLLLLTITVCSSIVLASTCACSLCLSS